MLPFSHPLHHDNQQRLEAGEKQRQIHFATFRIPASHPSLDKQIRLGYFTDPLQSSCPTTASHTTSSHQSAIFQGIMASSRSESQAAFSSHSGMPVMEQHGYPSYNPLQQQQAFYDSFSMMPVPMQMQMNRQQQHSVGVSGIMQQPQQQNSFQQLQSHSMMAAPSLSRPISRQDSVEYDDDYDCEEEEEDTSEVMIPTDDIETRLKVAQEAQDAAASEGPNGVFCCPYCDKRYAGKHARSIWRRHLQDKHAIPLSQQPRRTRWDGDVNRPKNAEERRQRMLESKRRWARKKRQAEKTGGKASADDSFGEVSPSESSFRESSQKPASSQQGAAISKKRTAKPKGPQQIKFHNVTSNEMPPFVDFGSSSATGGGGMLWPTANDATFQIQRDSNRSKPFSSSTLSAAHNFSRKGVYMPSQQSMSMMTTMTSPRKALTQIDTNTANGRRMMRPNADSNGMVDVKAGIKAHSSQFSAIDMTKMTPMNRFNQTYPTPPSGGDPKSEFIRQDMMINSKLMMPGNENSIPLLSPPVSHHNGESSPSYLGSSMGLNMQVLGKRSSTAASFSPAISRADSSIPRSPATNPFSLDRHKISPSTSSRTLMSDALQPPTSASRLITALDGTHEHKLSPIQNRTRSDAASKDHASPLAKISKLPSLVKTPLRHMKMEDNRPTPSTAMDMIGNAASLRRVRPSNGLIGGDPWKALMTPMTEEHVDRPLGGTSGLTGFTPFTVKSSRYSTTRGLASVTRPSRDNGDQFSSPQHLNLTQSLGLAPHSTGKGAFGSVNATPYVSSFLNNNSPWPESVLRPTFKTSASKRGRDDDASREDGSSERENEEEDDDDDENGGELFIHETPSRPAKHLRSSLLGSNGNSSAQTNRSGRLPSSASREQHSVKPISFNLSSDREEKNLEAEQEAITAAAATNSIDSETNTKSSPPSFISSHSLPQSDDDVGEEPLSPTMAHNGSPKRLLHS